MKIVVKILSMVFITSIWSTQVLSARCQSGYMTDSCSVDGYAMVEVETFTRSKHNHMHDIHNFGEKKVTKKRKKRIKNRYRYVKKCRYTKVRR